MIEGTYEWRPDHIPTFGKDHLVLADWRLSTPRRKWQRRSQGAETGVFEYEFERPGNRSQLVTLESGAETPFPALNDDQFLISLMTLSELAGCPEVLRFEPSHLLRVIRRADCQNNIRRAQEALKRYKAMSAHFEGLWFDRKAAKGDLSFSSGIIADFGFESGRGRRKQGTQRASYVQWTKSFYESMKNGNLINVNLDDLAACSARTGAMQLFRMTNKVWHGGRKPSVYQRDLKELACAHLRMKNDKWTKRNFHNIVEWMEKAEFIKPAEKADRYLRVAHGVWRVQLEIHPSRVVKGRTHKIVSVSDNRHVATKPDEATRLIQAYMQARFQRTDYRPTKKDRDRAQSLLKQTSLDVLLQWIPKVVAAVRAKNADDCYFGFAEPYFQKELAQQTSRTARKQQHDDQSQQVRDDLDRIEHQKNEKRAQHQARLQLWCDASQEQKTGYVQAALNEATTSAARETILNASFDAPPAAVLRQIQLTNSHPLPTSV